MSGPLRRARPTALAILLVATLLGATACDPPPQDGATVSGVLWRDVDSDGVRDPAEPGIRGIVVAEAGTGVRTVTDAEGRYRLWLPTGTHTVSAITGWLASQCPGDLYCALGRGPNQRFEVINQFVRRTLSIAAGQDRPGLDGGFLPDHGDPSGAPGSRFDGNDAGDGSAAVTDVAVRHSATANGFNACTDPSGTRVCSLGDNFTTNAQIYNQATAALPDVRFLVTVPPGARLVRSPTPNPSTPGPSATATGRSGTSADGGRWVEYRLGAGLPAAAAVWFNVHWEIVSGPPSPTPYRTGQDRDRRSFLAVTTVGVADRDSAFGTNPFADRDGGHNMNWPVAVDEDSSDTVNWNTDAR